MSHTPSPKKRGGKHHIKFAPTFFFRKCLSASGVYISTCPFMATPQ